MPDFEVHVDPELSFGDVLVRPDSGAGTLRAFGYFN
jgi:hypothetical protein